MLKNKKWRKYTKKEEGRQDHGGEWEGGQTPYEGNIAQEQREKGKL